MYLEKNSIDNWDYNESVKQVKPMVMSWRNLTVEIARELYLAREALSRKRSYSPKTLKTLTNVSNDTFDDYIRDIGLKRMTVHRWLERYVPEEDKLLTPEELAARKKIEAREKQNEAVAIRNRISEYRKKGEKPADWDNKTEIEYNKKIKEEQERKARAEKTRERIEEEAQERIDRQEEEEAKRERINTESDMLSEAVDYYMGEQKKREEFKQRIRLSQTGEKDVFIDALMDYLEELENDSRRIEACQNIIKVCKTIAVELQRDGNGRNKVD